MILKKRHAMILAICSWLAQSSSCTFAQLPPDDLTVISNPYYIYENQGFELRFLVGDLFLERGGTRSSYLVQGSNIAVFYQISEASLIAMPPPGGWHPSNDFVIQTVAGLPAGEYSIYAVPFYGDPPLEFDFLAPSIAPRGTIAVLSGSLDLKFGLGSPRADEKVGGFGVIRGWACYARAMSAIPATIGKISYQVGQGAVKPVPYGSSRGDVTNRCDGRSGVGFAAPVNWNRFALGRHTFTLFVDGEEALRHDILVSGTGQTYLRGLDAQYSLPGFPKAGDSTTVKWSQTAQDFTIVDVKRE